MDYRSFMDKANFETMNRILVDKLTSKMLSHKLEEHVGSRPAEAEQAQSASRGAVDFSDKDTRAEVIRTVGDHIVAMDAAQANLLAALNFDPNSVRFALAVAYGESIDHAQLGPVAHPWMPGDVLDLREPSARTIVLRAGEAFAKKAKDHWSYVVGQLDSSIENARELYLYVHGLRDELSPRVALAVRREMQKGTDKESFEPFDPSVEIRSRLESLERNQALGASYPHLRRAAQVDELRFKQLGGFNGAWVNELVAYAHGDVSSISPDLMAYVSAFVNKEQTDAPG